MLTKENILKTLKTRRAYLYNQFRVIEIGIFGSFATDSGDVNSDIDFLVEFDTENIDNYYQNKYQLKKYLEKFLTEKLIYAVKNI